LRCGKGGSARRV